EWVSRFAAPILAEQDQVIERAQSLAYTAPRKGQSSLPLGLAVQLSTRDKGVAIDDHHFHDSWTAYQLHDTRWVVRFTYTSRKRIQHADWEVDVRAGALTALNRAASELGYVEKGRRRAGLLATEPPPVVDAGSGGTDTGPTSATPTARKRSGAKRASRKRAAKKTVP